MMMLLVRVADPPWGLAFALLAVAAVLVTVGLLALLRARRSTPPNPRETP